MCDEARKVWKPLGIYEIIDEALSADKSGSIVLEESLHNNRKSSPVLSQIGMKEIVAAGHLVHLVSKA